MCLLGLCTVRFFNVTRRWGYALMDSYATLAGVLWKAGGLLLSFLAGVVTATWLVATKFQQLVSRVDAVETSLADLSGLPEALGATMDRKLNRVHDRIDELMLVRGQ
jgi:hypothetical protein